MSEPAANGSKLIGISPEGQRPARKSALLYDFDEENEECGQSRQEEIVKKTKMGDWGISGERLGRPMNGPGQDFAYGLQYNYGQ
jgi:hypothetical protein